MRNLKKFLALVLAMMMTLSLMVTVNASSFDDDDDITAAYGEAVDVLTELGVIKGYGEGDPNEGKFLPKNNITRGEVAAILYRIHTGDVDDDYIHLYKDYSEFSDVLPGDWFAPYVNYCANNELIKGVGNGKFAPRANITGYEALVMILRAMGYNNPSEFTTSDWKAKASGYGNRHGLTTNIPAGSLGGSATREMVSEIMFKGLLAPMQNYSILTGYTTDLLVDAKAVNAAAGAGAVVYAADVPNTLMYQTFKIVGCRTVKGADNYGRPQKEWVTDHEDDTLANGGKFIPNYESAYGTLDATANGKTADASYADVDDTELEIADTPVKVYKGTVVTECQFTTDVNNNKTIAAADITEYLNGGKVNTRGAALDINHTQEGTIGAPGRITEVYKDGSKFTIVYVDTFLGVVTKVINRTFDTAGNHVMSDAELHVKVNDTVSDVVETSSKKDFTEYKVGDLVLLNTYGFKDDDGTTADTTALTAANIQTSVPTLAVDFLKDNDTATSWAIEAVGKPTSEDVTVKGTFGTKNHKTGIETDKGDRMANVVYLASANDKGTGDTDTGVQYYQGDATTTITTQTTVPSTSPYNYGHRMVNAAINKTYTVYKDANGFVVGMTATETASGVGVVMSMEPVRVGTGKWAIEAEMMMMDKTKQTVRFVDHGALTAGTALTGYKFFASQTAAETSITNADKNLAAAAGVLVRIEPFTLDGATYYKVTETQNGKWQAFTSATAAAGNIVATGVANTLYSATPTTNTGDAVDYSAAPTQGATNTVKNNVDDNTKFLIAEVNWDYSLNEGNVGGYTDMDYSAYTGFKTIPTVESAQAHVMFQRIGNNVFVHPLDTALAAGTLEYTIKSQTKVADVDAYLVYATGVTYAEYSTYKALKNGEPVDLQVSNNNLKLVNDKIEDAMAKATVALITVTSTNSKGYVTDVEATSLAANKLEAADGVCFDKTGVIGWNDGDGTIDGTDIGAFYTVADDCVVKIVNLETGTYYNATLDSVSQYEKYTGSHDFIIDKDEFGYVDTIYIID